MKKSQIRAFYIRFRFFSLNLRSQTLRFITNPTVIRINTGHSQVWPVSNDNFSPIIFHFDVGRTFGKRFQANLVNQAKVEHFQVVWQNIGTVGAGLQAVARKLVAGGAKPNFFVAHTIPGIANGWFNRAIPFHCAASWTRQFFCRNSPLNHALIQGIVFIEHVQFANATVDPTRGDQAEPVVACIHVVDV